MNLRERQSSRKYIVVPPSPLGGGPPRVGSRSPLSTPPYGDSREATLRPGVFHVSVLYSCNPSQNIWSMCLDLFSFRGPFQEDSILIAYYSD